MIKPRVSNKKNTTSEVINIPLISKTVLLESGEIVKGIDVEKHCKITGYVAEELIRTMPVVKQLLPQGLEIIAACHDVGKISPAFQKMIYQALSGNDINRYSEFSSVNAESAKRKNKAFHAKVSAVSLNSKGKYIADIEGRHHGFKPSGEQVAENNEIYGGELWNSERKKLIRKLEECFKINNWPQIEDFIQANAVTGLVTVADWIGSGGDFSSLTLQNQSTDEDLKTIAKKAVADAGFEPLQVKKNLSFTDVFGFSPRDIQEKLIQSVNGKGVYILEAPMGIGKTEAALYAAYKLLEKNLVTGIYFALPTQLTSNKICERVNAFIKNITFQSCNYRARLLHSNAWMDNVFGEDADVGGSWFDSSKRGILAPFAVGTIDQALMAVMNVKHGFVRTFGLAGKVVILDEVHSYDSYTGTIMNELIQALSKVGATVIILSATLTENQKISILNCDSQIKLNNKYPLITSYVGSQLDEQNVYSQKESKYKLETTADVNMVFENVLERAENGELVLWIENTVYDAQNIYKKFSARIDKVKTECGLLHSRFIKHQRIELENKWISIYGKDAGELRGKKGRILIGTQVLEQSLDIDADYLVTRLCPADMLLQRIGRAWRHECNNKFRPKFSERNVTVLIPEEKMYNQKYPFGLSGAVYSEYVLFRTLEVCQKYKSINLPIDIREIMEATYKEREESNKLAELKGKLNGKKALLKSLATLTTSTEYNTLSETKAQTRYSELETITVLLVRSFNYSEKNKGTKIVFVDDSELLIPEKCFDRRKKIEIVSKIMQNTVVLNQNQAPSWTKDVEHLKTYVYTGNEEDENPFRVALVKNDDSVRCLGSVETNKEYNIYYTNQCGYIANKIEGVGND